MWVRRLCARCVCVSVCHVWSLYSTHQHPHLNLSLAPKARMTVAPEMDSEKLAKSGERDTLSIRRRSRDTPR